jgi:hypothetical protein
LDLLVVDEHLSGRACCCWRDCWRERVRSEERSGVVVVGAGVVEVAAWTCW